MLQQRERAGRTNETTTENEQEEEKRWSAIGSSHREIDKCAVGKGEGDGEGEGPSVGILARSQLNRRNLVVNTWIAVVR